jgi:hypothetical protein
MKPKALVGLLAGGIILYSALWYSMGLNIERQIVEQLNHFREKGIIVKHSPPALSGFPYRLQITLSDVSLKAKNFDWQASAKTATAIGHLWTPDHWFLRLGGADVTALDGALSLASNDSLSSIVWSDGGALQIGIDLSSAKASGKMLGANSIKASKAELHLIIPPSQDLSSGNLLSPLIFKGALRIANATSGDAGYPPFDRGEILFALHGAGLSEWSKNALKNWRDIGGTLEITALSTQWGKSELDGSASLTLDEALRPLGAATVTLKNAEALLNNLKKLDLISEQPNPENGIISLMAQSGELTANGKLIAILETIKP